MTTLFEIKAAIDRLSPQEYCELLAMLHPGVDDEWDRYRIWEQDAFHPSLHFKKVRGDGLPRRTRLDDTSTGVTGGPVGLFGGTFRGYDHRAARL